MAAKLIIALDFASRKEALILVDQLDPQYCALKIGLEMYTRFGPQWVLKLSQFGFKIFLDLKFHDIPNTVAQACKVGADLGVWMMNVHAAGGLAMMEAAQQALVPYGTERPLLVAVTVLTSLRENDMPILGFDSTLEDQVARFAQLSFKAGLDGVVCSPYEVPNIKQTCGPAFLTVTPGIRLTGDSHDDQSRVITPEQALRLGSDYLVMGRSITQSQTLSTTLETIYQIISSCPTTH